jgi:hypothetical protein
MRFISLALLFGFYLTTSNAQTELIAPFLTDTELIDYLQSNYTAITPKSYNSARDAMYGTIDNKNGQIIGVYTGFTITANTRGDAFDKGINTEHTWPQGLFDKDEPMRGDIHHLFPTRIEANSARSNFPFDEIPDNQTNKWFYLENESSTIPSSNIDLYSELDSGSRFEPREDHKGNVARSIFYFWTMYQDRAKVSDDASFFNGMKDVLLQWHDLDPVDESEVNRSIAIEDVQGNRNPFVHDSTLVRRAYFGGSPVTNDFEDEITKNFFQVYQNYPNPFNPNTKITFYLPEAGFVSIDVYSLTGVKVAQIAHTNYNSGNHTLNYDASNLTSGVYIVRVNYKEKTLTRSITLIK